MEMTKMSFTIAYKKKSSYYIVIGKCICFIGFARLDFVETKIGSRKIPDFSFISSQILAKSRIFVIYTMGLFFPASRVEQAHFSSLTTCLTTCGDFCTIYSYKKCKICTFVFMRRCKFVFIRFCSRKSLF